MKAPAQEAFPHMARMTDDELASALRYAREDVARAEAYVASLVLEMTKRENDRMGIQR